MAADENPFRTSDTERAFREPCAPSIERDALGGLDMTCLLSSAPLAGVVHVRCDPHREQFTVQLAIGRCSWLGTLGFGEFKNLAAAVNALLVRVEREGKR